MTTRIHANRAKMPTNADEQRPMSTDALVPQHYGRFGQNLSKNSRDVLFHIIRIFLIPKTLKGINKASKFEKGQQSF